MFHRIIGTLIINTKLSQDFIDHHRDDKFKIKNKELIKIKRIKVVPKLITVATIGIALLLLSTVVQAKITIRPLDDYAGEYVVFFDLTDPSKLKDYEGSFTAWYDPESGLTIFPHGISWFMAPGLEEINFLFFQFKLLKDCPHEGTIMEREIDEEHVLITINLHAKEVPFMIFSDDEITGEYPYFCNYPPVYKGIMNYSFECKILYNKAILDSWFVQWGRLPSIAEIAFILPLFYPPDLVPIIMYSRMTGNGIVTEGGEGRVVVNQIGLFDPETGGLKWPKDITIVVP